MFSIERILCTRHSGGRPVPLCLHLNLQTEMQNRNQQKSGNLFMKSVRVDLLPPCCFA